MSDEHSFGGLLLITHYSLLITHYWLLITHYFRPPGVFTV